MSMNSQPYFTFFYALICLSIFLEFSIGSDTITPTQSISDGQTLVSSSRRFELGFFSPGNSKNRYIGIWYKNTPDTVVWVANRNNPITDSYGALIISSNGTLVLLNQKKSTIWYSNLSREAESPVAQLLDTGNLVVIDKTSMSSESYLWQSFDYPSDTRLPGMKMGWNPNTGLDRYLTSWKSADDPSPGDFTYRIDNNGLPQMVIAMGSKKIFRSGPWNGVRFSGLPMFSNPMFTNPSTTPVLVFNKEKLMCMYDPSNSSIIRRQALNYSGLLLRYVLNDKTEWTLTFTEPNDPCDSYGQCGANSICTVNKSPICECLKGFTPKSQQQWQVLDWSGGCVRSMPLDCQSREGFAKLAGVKVPDLLKFLLNGSMSLKECQTECLKNCSCTAYANSNISEKGSGCLMWFGDLIDIREFNVKESQQDIYIRLPASELGLESKKEDLELPLFDFGTIAAATDNFSHTNKIGEGGFGPVYKGNLSMGQEIAVKRLSRNSGQGLEEFKNEVILIAKLQHRNLVRILGCCIQGEERMLIYEYMPNKSLDCFIFDRSRSASLGWQKRFDIALGIARGLLYLHQDSRLRIIHRDLKTSNILLDSDLNPKISDFGLARIFGGDQIYAKTKRVIGTYGYMSPEYAIDGKFSVKSDVFSLGVLLLEIVSGKRNRGFHHPDHHHNLLGHAWLLWNEDKALELMDACLEDSYVESQVLRCIQVGLLCVQKLPQDRPAMSSVVFMLGNEGAMLPQPKEPGFFIERSSTDTTSSKEEFHTGDAETITILEAR